MELKDKIVDELVDDFYDLIRKYKNHLFVDEFAQVIITAMAKICYDKAPNIQAVNELIERCCQSALGRSEIEKTIEEENDSDAD